MAQLDSIPWSVVLAVAIRTTADGPFGEDVFWQLMLTDGQLIELPGGVVVEDVYAELTGHLPGVDHAKIIKSMSSTQPRTFRIWHREESTASRDRGDLARRFAGMVGRVGGNPDEAGPVFDRVYARWSETTRSYHDVEHLVDCLYELDAANARVPTADVVEFALWYHDVVYDALAKDNEEKSALMLLADATALAIPAETAELAASLVRATAHLDPTVTQDHTYAVDLMLDVDLSILGRDPLRFLDFDYAVEEEYAAVPTDAFIAGRARFLASLLTKPHIFRSEYFRARYEASARRNVAAILKARYSTPQA